jgi:hypothetical protein
MFDYPIDKIFYIPQVAISPFIFLCLFSIILFLIPMRDPGNIDVGVNLLNHVSWNQKKGLMETNINTKIK